MEWPRQPLKHLAQVSVSNVDKKSSDDEVPVRLVNYTDVYYGDRLTPELDLMQATASSRQVDAFRLQPGDVVITKDSETADDIGIAAFVERSAPDVVCGYHLSILRPRPGQVDGRFLYWSMKGDDALGQLCTGATGVTRYGLRTDVIASTQICVPPLAAQRAIADYLDTETARIDALITKKRHMITLLEERSSTAIVEKTLAQAGRVALSRLVIPPIGGSWGAPPGEGPVDALCVRGTDFDMSALSVLEESAPVRSYEFSDFASKNLIPGDLIIEKSGGGENQPVGRVVRWSGSEPAVPTNFAARLRPTTGIDSRWLCYLLRGAYDEGRTRAWIKQTTGIQNLDLGGFLSERVHLPSYVDQVRIANELDERLSIDKQTCAALEKQLTLLAEHRQALITAAVTGELRVPGAGAAA